MMFIKTIASIILISFIIITSVVGALFLAASLINSDKKEVIIYRIIKYVVIIELIFFVICILIIAFELL